MGPELVLNVMGEAVLLIITLLLIILVPALIVGLAVSMFMAATSLSEQTLTFIPKLIVTFGILLVAGPYMLNRLMEYMTQMYINIPMYLSGSIV